MASLKEIRSRIDSTKNTQQITRAMKLVSAAKLRRAQSNIVNLRPYAHKLMQVIANLAATHRIEHPLLKPASKVNRVLIVVLTSDRGLCGAFNTNIHRFTEKYYQEHKSHYQSLDFFFIGRKAADYFSRKFKIVPKEIILNLARDVSYSMAVDIAQRMMKNYQQGAYDEIRLVYNEFKSALQQFVVSETLFPVDLSAGEFGMSTVKYGFAKDFIFEPRPELMIEPLLLKHFSTQMYRCLSESIAAEHGARMTAMENATKNAKEMIQSLTLTYNKLRQASITTELIEITSGAEALKT